MKFLPRKRCEKEIIEKKKTFENTRRLRKAKYLLFNWLNWRKTHISYLGNLEFVFLVSGWVNFFIKTKKTHDAIGRQQSKNPRKFQLLALVVGKKGPFFYSKTLRIKRKIKIKPKRETLEFVEIVLCFLHFLYFLYFMYFFMIIWDNTRYGDLLAARLDNEPNGSTISYIWIISKRILLYRHHPLSVVCVFLRFSQLIFFFFRFKSTWVSTAKNAINLR